MISITISYHILIRNYNNYSSLTPPKFRKFTHTMISSYSRPGSLDPLFSKPAFMCDWLAAVGRPFNSICRCPVLFRLCSGAWMSSNHLSQMKSQSWQPPKERVIKYCLTPLFNDLRLHVSSFFDLGNLGEFGDVGAYFHRAYSEINALHGWHRTPCAYSEIIVLGAHTQKSSYSTDGSAYRKNRKKSEKKEKKKKKEPAEVFFFFFFFFG